MWLLLNQTLAPADVLFGALRRAWSRSGVCRAAVAASQTAAAAALLQLARGLVLIDIVRSNIAVARIVLHPGTRERTSGFRDNSARAAQSRRTRRARLHHHLNAGHRLGALRLEPQRLTIHVLDLIDEKTWIRTIKDRYERRLLEIFRMSSMLLDGSIVVAQVAARGCHGVRRVSAAARAEGAGPRAGHGHAIRQRHAADAHLRHPLRQARCISRPRSSSAVLGFVSTAALAKFLLRGEVIE